MVHPPVTSVLGEYFSKKRGMANALAFSGASLGNLVFAPVMTSLFETYGYTGTMFVVAGMTLNICVTGALMRPMNSFRKVKESVSQLDNTDKKEAEAVLHDNQKENHIQIKISSDKHEFSSLEIMPLKVSEIKKENVQLFRQHSYDPKRDPSESPIVPRQRTWSATARSHASRTRPVTSHEHHGHLHEFIESLSRSEVSLYTSTTEFYGSVVDVRKSVERTLSQTEDPESGSEQSCCFACKKNAAKIFKLLFDFSLIRNPVFLVFMLMAFLVHAGTALALILIAPHAKDIGLQSDQIGILLSIVGCFDLIGRVTLAIIADRNFVKRTTILGLAVGIVGLVSQFLRFFTSFGSMVFFSIIAGTFTHIIVRIQFRSVSVLEEKFSAIKVILFCKTK